MARFRLTIVNAHTDLLYCCMCTSKQDEDWQKGNNSEGQQGWQSGESIRLRPMWPGLEPSEAALRHILLEFVFGFHPCPERFFSDTSVFSCPQKRTISNSTRFGIVDETPQCTFANTKLIYLFMYDDLFINYFFLIRLSYCFHYFYFHFSKFTLRLWKASNL